MGILFGDWGLGSGAMIFGWIFLVGLYLFDIKVISF